MTVAAEEYIEKSNQVTNGKNHVIPSVFPIIPKRKD